MAQVKAVAIAESYDAKGTVYLIQCLGAFNSYAEAYGEGMVYLSEMSNKDSTITPLLDLEGETGFGFSLKNGDGKEVETVFVLHVEQADEQQEGGA